MPADALHPWPSEWLVPDALPPGAGALMTTRAGGVSAGPYASMNLGSRVGDDPAHVAINREHLARVIGATPVYLHQVHGNRIVRLGSDGPQAGEEPQADACYTTERGWACVIQTADCLPVLFGARDGNGRACGVAAAHAGWRGLAGGVLDATVQALCEATSCVPSELWAWMGPGIGPQRFEVGADVLQAFGASAALPGVHFKRIDDAHWLADLPALAHARLADLGVRDIHGGAGCTASDSNLFSFRRDRVTGRMAACIWLQP